MREYKKGLLRVMLSSLLAGSCLLASTSAVNTYAMSTPAPDLIIDTMTWSPELPIANNTVTLTVTIENQGGGRAGASFVAYYIDDVYQTSASVDPIDPAATVIMTFTWKAKAGSHNIRAVADVLNQLNEIDETNNDKTFAFPVLAPDLVIQDFTWLPANPSIGDRVVFTVSIKNQGNSRAGFFKVDLYIDGNSTGYRDILGMDVGATVTETLTLNAQVGSHTVRAVADVFNQVNESDETNNDETVTCSTSPPDLIIQGITWSPASRPEGSTVTFTVTVKNQGSGKAGQSWVACYIDDTSQALFVKQLNAGAATTVTFTWTAQPGPHTVRAVADYNNNVVESDETNNTDTVALPTPSPDLIIQGITWSPASPLIGHRVDVTVSVKNQGGNSAGYSRVYLYIDGANRMQQDIGKIGAGATVAVTFFWTVQPGPHTVKAVADAENYMNESDESNNTKTVTMGSSRPGLSDLAVQSIVWSPANPLPGDTLTFTVTIKNQGSVPASTSQVDYYIDDTLQIPGYVNPINAGGTAAATFTWTAQAGSHIVKAVADPNNIIEESNETNNEKTVALSVSAPDLVIQDITWAPAPLPGDSIIFTVSIKNQGNLGAGRSYVAYYDDGASRGYHDVPEIAAGATVTRAFTWAVQPGPHIIKVVADMGNEVPESNETNNEKTVVFPAPDFVIQDITWSPASPSPGDSVTFTVTIKKQGSVKSGPSSIYLEVDGSPKGSESIPDMDAGATVTKTFAWEAQAGSHVIKAVSAAEKQLTESDESSNEKTVYLSVLLPPSAPPPAPAPEPSPAPQTGPGQQEEAHPDSQSNKASPGQNTALNLPEEPSFFHSSWKGIWVGWWLVLTVVVLGGIITLLVLRSRKEPH